MIVDLMVEFAVEGLEDNWRIDTMRNERNRMLIESDWTQYTDSPLSDSKKAEWATYRQQLRDFPASWTPADTAEFPDPPS